MLEGLDAFAGTTYISESDISILREVQGQHISSFTLHVDPIINALGFTEMELNSAFAKDNQTPYEALLETAKQSDMNDNNFIRPDIAKARNMWKQYRDVQAKL